MKKFLLAILVLSLFFSVEAAKKKKKNSDPKDQNGTSEKAAAVKAPEGWLTDLATAQRLAVQKKKPILILISGPEWCGPCRRLDTDVIRNAKFKKISAQKVIRVYLHVPRKNCPASTRADVNKCRFYSGGVPSYAIVDAKLNVLATPKNRTVQAFLSAIDEAVKKLNKK